MATGGPLPWLRVGGVEISNAARTVDYLRRGLGGTQNGRWEIGDGALCGVLYRTNGGTCAHPEMFTHPAVDPAPWYDASEPGSTSFLGFVLLDIVGYDSTIVRTATPRLTGLGGGTLSAQYRKVRTWRFRGAMVSSDDVGAEYGLRWLQSALEATECDTCGTNQLEVRLSCTPADCSNDEQGLWSSYEAALVDGPHEVEPWGPAKLRADSDILAGCRDWVTVEFTIVAANPWLYKPPHVCLEETELVECGEDCEDICTFLSGASTAPCCSVDPPQRGVLGAIFTLTNLTSTPYGEVQLESRAQCGDTVPLLALLLSGIPAFSTVIVDCSRHTVTIVDDAGDETDGQYLIEIPEGKTIEWIEVAKCESAVCLCAKPVGGAPGHSILLEIATQAREG